MRVLVSMIIFVLSAGFLDAQILKETAERQFRAGEWKEAASTYKKILATDDGDSSDWYNLAYCSEQDGQYDSAVNYFMKAEDHGFSSNYTRYGIAKSYALKGDVNQCLATLKYAAREGLKFYTPLQNDSAFKDVREMAGFKEILDKIKTNAFPCWSRSENRQLDFWVGQWDVYSNGQKVGESSVTVADGGCAIHESYRTPGIYSGQSINFYDPLDHEWHQYWVSSVGGVISFDETDHGEGMLQFTGQAVAPNGKVSLNRMTFSSNGNGTVRQLIEVSSDDGKSWETGFDGLYKPRIRTP